MIKDDKTDFILAKVCPDLSLRWQAVRQEIWNLTGRQIRVTDGLRTFAEQWELWCKGRLKDKNGDWVVCDKKLVVTHAMPLESFHNFGLALDSCFMGDDPYLTKMSAVGSASLWDVYGECVKDQGMVWGGSWKEPKRDRPHCEMTYGITLQQLQVLFQDQGLNAVWKKCSGALLCGRELV